MIFPRQLNRSRNSQVTVWALVVVLFVSGLPMLSGVVVAGDSQPAFTLDICHPAGGAAHTLTPFEAPLIPMPGFVPPQLRFATAHEFVIDLSSRPNEAPNPPPPKARA